MNAIDHVSIGLLGLGTIGGGVYRALTERADALAQQVGCPLTIRRILERDPSKAPLLGVPLHLVTTRAADVLADPDIHIIVEVLGGEEPAGEYISTAVNEGKHVVTANKEVMAKKGWEILALAAKQGVQVLFEASVGGGIPIIGPLRKDLLANQVQAVHAIINGTTNYILTRMAQEGTDFQVALREAQALGYAEADPTNDVEGIDAAYKLAILASLAFHTRIHADDVYHEGISRLGARDFRYAEELGYAIKLLAITRREADGVQVRVHPTFLPRDILLAKVEGVFNAVEVEGDLVGRVLFHGRGAGPQPTSSAVVGDILEIARGLARGVEGLPPVAVDHRLHIKPMGDLETKYYIRMTVTDRAGVLAQIARVMADNHISIASVIQKEADPEQGTADIVLMTHPSRESSMQRALGQMEQLEVVSEIGNLVRVEELED